MHHIGLSREEIDHVQSLIDRLDGQPAGAEADRRVHPRIDFAHAMWLNLPTEPGAPWVHIFSRNLSTGGLAFLSRRIFYVDQHLVISHELKEHTPLLVLASVCFCRKVDNAIYEVGLAFKAIEYDPERQRRIPSRWLATVVQSDWLARRKNPAMASTL
ncbi:MAG TPA: PilZ domain-containing protein [Phycisphaerae bacterium]|nr:PilZ domain-containing protein [Phycisphaerae bacterium]